MGDGEICLTMKEADRAAVLREVAEKRVTRREAA